MGYARNIPVARDVSELPEKFSGGEALFLSFLSPKKFSESALKYFVTRF